MKSLSRRRAVASVASLVVLAGCAGRSDPPPRIASAPAPSATSSVRVDETCAPGGRSIVEKMTLAVCKDVSADVAFSPGEREAIARARVLVSERLRAAFGTLTGETAHTVFCKTRACRTYFAGTTERQRVILSGQRVPGASYVGGATPTVILNGLDLGTWVHELVHIEMRTRLGDAHVPDWFEEGLAFAWGQTLNVCSKDPPHGIDDLRRLDRVWGAYLDTRIQDERSLVSDHSVYCQAGAEVDAWLKKNGRDALFALLEAVRKGGRFDDVYGPMLTQQPRPASTEMSLSRATTGAIELEGRDDSFVQTFGSPHLGAKDKPLSLSLWVKPHVAGGTLAHVSWNADGTGWCVPFLGFGREDKLVAQLLHGNGPERSEFAVATAPKVVPPGVWTHLAMTWRPEGTLRLYVNGARSAETPAPAFAAAGGGAFYVTWGSPSTRGRGCWGGAITPGGFRGSIAKMSVVDRELSAEDVARLAQDKP